MECHSRVLFTLPRYISEDVKVTDPSTEITGNRLSYGQIDADEKCLRLERFPPLKLNMDPK